MDFLIVGLGNPGTAYAHTRHNMGFIVMEKFAVKYKFAFRNEGQFSAQIATGQFAGNKVVLLLPLTYMNSSGEAVQRCANYFRIPAANILVVCDDVALPFGTLRLRDKGSAGGHNGLKSIEAHLGTQDYPRLRVGISDRAEGELADYVLGRFTDEEEKALPKVVESAAQEIEQWLNKKMENKQNV